MAEASTLIEQAVAEEHAPELYTLGSVATPLNGLGAIDAAAVARYRADGFLAVANALSPEEVEAARTGLTALTLGENPDFKGVLFEAAARERLSELSGPERELAVRKLFSFVNFDERLGRLANGHALQAAASKLMGGAEPKLFQDMALVKPPKIGREKPWHQDCAYFNFAQGTPVVGIWIALDEATIENGCMFVLPGAHRDGPRIHWKRRDWQLCDREMLRVPATAVPLPPGGALFFDGLLPHGTPVNKSGKRRRALQYHYAPAGAVQDAKEERLKLFGSEGKDVSC
ncbi:MAG: hypothetical protein AMXMBFR7_26030 [Planctomycetota bacterium]